MRKRFMNRGSAVVDVMIFAALLVFVILPVFSLVFEKYLLLNKVQSIKDAVDMAAISTYNSLNADRLGRMEVFAEISAAEETYINMLAANLKLDNNLNPFEESLAEGKVEIKSLIFYGKNFPLSCPKGLILTKPSVHSIIDVPVKPSLYRRIILSLTGQQYFKLEVHTDSEIPVNN